MFDDIRKMLSRKRPAGEALVSNVSGKEYMPEKKVRAVQRACAKCLAGDGGHITHVLSEVPLN